MVSCIILSKTGMAQSNVHLSNQPKSILENNTSSSKSKDSIGCFRITSPFGWRVDPITGRWALHQGVDIAGKRGSPILAPAKGRVCKTSQQANLGYLLEIDHGRLNQQLCTHRWFCIRRGLCARGAAHCYPWKFGEELRPPLTLWIEILGTVG
jgi:hypothetical protein